MERSKTKVKCPRRSFKEWWAAHKPSKRRLIQVYAALLYNANIKGYISGEIYTSETTKYMCVPGLNCYSCPAAVGACPLGALQNALAASKTRAPYYVFGILALFGLVFARTICGFLCPVGLGQELLYKICTPKLKKSRFTRVMSYFKYVILALLVIILPLMYALRDVPLPAFCKYICPAGTIGGAIGLLIHPDNGDMFAMLGGQFLWKFSLLVAFIVASIFIFRFFCRFFCPLGAIYGFFNKIALLGVKVDQNACTDCGKCVAVCKMDVKCVGDHECIHCGNCMSVCPTKAISWKGAKLFALKSAEQETDVGEEAAELTATVDVKAINKRKLGKRDARLWIQITACIAALAVLVGAYVYYNAIDVPKPIDPPPSGTVDIGYQVGQTAPNFTVKLYGSDGEFDLYEHRGKLTVVNFWATWCTPCVAEIPYFNELSVKHPEINVVAIHGVDSDMDKVPIFIETKEGWEDFTLTFAQDNLDGKNCLTFQMLGGKSMWPMTVIVDSDGKVVYNSTQSFHDYEQLEQLVMGLVAVQER